MKEESPVKGLSLLGVVPCGRSDPVAQSRGQEIQSPREQSEDTWKEGVMTDGVPGRPLARCQNSDAPRNTPPA